MAGWNEETFKEAMMQTFIEVPYPQYNSGDPIYDETEKMVERIVGPVYNHVLTWWADSEGAGTFPDELVKMSEEDLISGYLGDKIDDLTIKYDPDSFKLYVDTIPLATSNSIGGIQIGAQSYLYIEGNSLLLNVDTSTTLSGGWASVPASKAVQMYVAASIQKATLNGSIGDMLKSLYDANDNGVVDDSEKLDSQSPSYYLTWSNFTGTPTTISGYGITDVYTETELDTFFEGESSGKKQITWDNVTDQPTIITLTNDTDNLLITGTGTGALEAEDNLQFDGSTLTVIGNILLNDSNTGISEDGSGNLTFTDAITGAKTLAELATSSSGVTPTDNILDWDGTNNWYAPYSVQTPGAFDSSTTTPVDTNRLNYDGILYARSFWAECTSGQPPFYSVNSGTGYGMYSTNSGAGRAVGVNNSSTGTGISLTNSSTGTGILLNNSSTGTGLELTNSVSGYGIIIYSNNYGGTCEYLSNYGTYGIDIKNAGELSIGLRIRNDGSRLTSGNFIDLTRTQTGSLATSGDFINLVDNPTTTGTISGKVLTATIGTTERVKLDPRVSDGSTAVGYFFDTHNELSSTGAKVLSLANQGSEVFNIDYRGDINLVGTASTRINFDSYLDFIDSNNAGDTLVQIGSIRTIITNALQLFGGTAPSTPFAGDIYYDSTTNKLRCYNGTIWNDLF